MIVEGPQLRPYFERLAGPLPEKAHFIGRWENDALLGVVAVWNLQAGVNAEVGWAGSTGHWLSRRFLRVVFAYLWHQLGLRRITGRIYADNAAAIAASTRLGFKHEGTLRQATADGGDVLIYGLLQQECPHGWQQ